MCQAQVKFGLVGEDKGSFQIKSGKTFKNKPQFQQFPKVKSFHKNPRFVSVEGVGNIHYGLP